MSQVTLLVRFTNESSIGCLIRMLIIISYWSFTFVTRHLLNVLKWRHSILYNFRIDSFFVYSDFEFEYFLIISEKHSRSIHYPVCLSYISPFKNIRFINEYFSWFHTNLNSTQILVFFPVKKIIMGSLKFCWSDFSCFNLSTIRKSYWLRVTKLALSK